MNEVNAHQFYATSSWQARKQSRMFQRNEEAIKENKSYVIIAAKQQICVSFNLFERIPVSHTHLWEGMNFNLQLNSNFNLQLNSRQPIFGCPVLQTSPHTTNVKLDFVLSMGDFLQFLSSILLVLSLMESSRYPRIQNISHICRHDKLEDANWFHHNSRKRTVC